MRCWHGGDGKRSDGGNYSSIAIEICVNRDGNYLQAIVNAVELVQHIMKVEGIPISRVYQHNHWSGKNCPRSLRNGNNGINWSEFITLIRDNKIKIDSTNITDLFNRTLLGEFGNGETRKKMLGKYYPEVQKKINAHYSYPKVNKVNKINIDKLVSETIRGDYGNGKERERKLGVHYSEVQRKINKLYS